MSKTKNEIFGNRAIYLGENEITGVKKDVFDAMDEYAKQEAIEFAKWLKQEGWEWSSMFEREEWGNYNAEVPDFKSETELYSIYLSTKTK